MLLQDAKLADFLRKLRFIATHIFAHRPYRVQYDFFNDRNTDIMQGASAVTPV